MFIDGKYRSFRNRRYCLDCSPFGSKNTRVLDPEIRRLKGLDNPECTCVECGRIYVYKREGQTKTVCNSCHTKKRRINSRIKAYLYKGKSCIVCGYDKCELSLHFHHLYDKKFDVGGNMNRSWETIKQELDKCVLLCSNCHGEVHSNMITDEELVSKENLRKLVLF